jgi:hypothetical protein
MTTPTDPTKKKQFRILNAGIKLFFALLFGVLAMEMGRCFGSKVSEHAVLLLSIASLIISGLFILSAILSMVAARNPNSTAT